MTLGFSEHALLGAATMVVIHRVSGPCGLVRDDHLTEAPPTQGPTADLVSAEVCLAATPGPNRNPLSAAASPLEAAERGEGR
jgi:hypothetical protein